jgi:predicted phage terminase large subunit-like protein
MLRRQDLTEAQIKQMKDGVWVGPDPLGREPGEALWPERHTEADLDRVRAVVGDYDFHALFQQTPQQLEGALIKAHEILQIRVDQVPQDLEWVRYWDLSVSGKTWADFIAGGRVGRSSTGRIYIWHVAHIPGPWADARPDIVSRMQADGPEVVQGVEISGQQGGYCQELQRDEALQSLPIVGVNPQQVGSKIVRAQVWSSRIQDGLIHLVVGNGWDVEGFISECLAFPNGSHDDRVDCISGAVQMLGGLGVDEITSEDPGENFGEYGGEV